MIKIKNTSLADTRTCDYENVTIKQLYENSLEHIQDVKAAMELFIDRMEEASKVHDHTKLSHIDQFHKDFVGGFKTQDWYKMHKTSERHHLEAPEGVRSDVNLIDVFEYVCDCVCAGMGRSGKVRPLEISDEVLRRALNNTADALKKEIEVVE